MNLKEIKEWAESIEVANLSQIDRPHAKCYRDMIIEKSTLIDNLTSKISGYMQDIYEYVEQLGKINIVMYHPDKPLPTSESLDNVAKKGDVENEKKSSPLVP